MVCNFAVSELPSDFPKDDVDVYRLICENGSYYVRIDFSEKPHYLTITNENILFHSEFLVKLGNEGEVEECKVNSVMKSLVYGLLHELGIRRIEVNKKLESLLKKITDRNVKSTSEINQVRSEIITLYSDSSALLSFKEII
ncbi:hypothetical protein SUSAZ_10685 [Sulfolobus acidocaldarius SUSAZ]|nr:hypothetical protein SUSAZ_10685 [Sulfolobus acidocaldarius SUSAZ]